MDNPVSAFRDTNSYDGSVTTDPADMSLTTLDFSRDASQMPEDEVRAKRRCITNIVINGVSVMFVFTSFLMMLNTEGGVNARHDSSTVSLFCLYAGTFVSCFYSPSLVRATGYKWTTFICFVMVCLYSAVNFYPKVYILAPVCGLLGLVTGPFWVSQGLLVTTLAVQYAEHIEINPDVVISRFSGFFYMFFQSAQIWGNAVSSIVLRPADRERTDLPYFVNETCGSNFCYFPNMTDSSDLDAHDSGIIVGVYLACAVTGLLLFVVLVNNIKPLPGTDISSATTKETACSLLRIHGNMCMLLIIPMMIFNGLEQVFLFTDFSEAFVSCELGADYASFVLLTFGGVNALSSVAMGQLEKSAGRLLLFLVAMGLDLGLLLVMLEWTPGDSRKDNWLLYFIPGLWAVADSIWQTSTFALIAVEFPQARDAAFSAYRLWQVVGMGVSFAYSWTLCMRIKIYIALGLLGLSSALYLLMELVMRRRMKRPYIDLYAPIIE